jgi:Domain of unknown function (DUF2341)
MYADNESRYFRRVSETLNGQPRLRRVPYPVKRWLVSLGGCLSFSFGVFAVPLSNPAVDAYNVRVGTETFSGLYTFTTNTLLVETAEAMTNMGSDVIKFYLGSDASYQSGVTLGSNVTNLITLARDCPSYHQVLDMPFRHLIMWAYPFANADSWWANGYNQAQGTNDYREMYDLTRYLLTNYNNSGKTFYLGHWEGDGYLNVPVNGVSWATNPPAITIQGMIGWLNNRQQAVDDAKKNTPYTNVYVYNYAEANRVRDAMVNGPTNNQRVINMVVPYVTNLDYLSYSSYDAQDLDSTDLYATLNYMQSHLPPAKSGLVPGQRMWIGEYGWGYDPPATQEPLTRSYIQRLLNWQGNYGALQYILFWEIYNNQTSNGTNFYLISPTDTPAPCYYLHQRFLNKARLLVAQFNETNGVLPNDAQFSALASPMLTSPLPPPANLTVANMGASFVAPSSAIVSGSLAQGVYGDDEATLWVFWGLHDGGTNAQAWENSEVVAVNTNFNPRTYSVTPSNFVSQTNYYYRFYATNATTNAWAPVSSQFSTVTLTPSDFGSRMNIIFSGYSSGQTLVDFPVLVNLSTNLPGFSYLQFASPTGADLRFTDANGTSLIPFQIDEWNTNGISSVWVDVPSLSTSGDSIWAYWGNTSQDTPNMPSGNVWLNAGYEIVYHLSESGLPYADSTGQHPATGGVIPTRTAGVVGHGQAFNGTEYLSPGAVTLSNQFTTYAWIYVNPGASNIQTIWANQVGGYGANGFSWFVDTYNEADRVMHADSGNGAGSGADPTGTTTVSSGQWHFVAATWDQPDSVVNMYLDGALIGSGTVVNTFALTNTLDLGAFLNPAFQFNGDMDEARIQTGVASSNWIYTSWATVAANTELENYSTVVEQLPNLAISNVSNGIMLTWPGSGVGYTLYSTTNLAVASSWQPAAIQPEVVSNQWEVELPTNSNNANFYRLQPP